MKKLHKILSYVVVAALASMLTLATIPQDTAGTSKLDALETLILEKFIGEADATAMEDAAAAAMEAMDFPEIIGTLAGDDTLLVLFSNDRTAFEFCAKINSFYIKE